MKINLKKFGAVLLGLAMFASIAAAAVNTASAEGDNSGKNSVNANIGINSKIKEEGMQPQVAIGVNGRVLVRGAKITAISGNTVSAQVLWGSFASNWTVNVSNTSFLRHSGGSSAMSELSIGDTVSFSGMLDTSAANATVKADVIKDWSVDKKDMSHLGTLQGELKAIGGTTAPTTLNVDVRSKGKENDDNVTGSFAVNVAANTAILNNNWGTIGLSNLSVGDSVRFYGLINSDNTVNATVIRDLKK